jgi:hypothetical protein
MITETRNDIAEKVSSLPKIRIENMLSSSGREVPNQFILTFDKTVVFQSYKSVIAMQVGGQTILDKNKWDYSVTTGKYRNQFLGEGIAETRKKIASGEYVLADLNTGEIY